ncbi:putative C2 domain containing protein [Trypanosoma cruzi]|nr:putative C2 domain containing protein [Trypanosoma cruzi]
MRGKEENDATTPPTVLLPSGVYVTAPTVEDALGDATVRDGTAMEEINPHERVEPALMRRFDRHRRLRRAMAAREATLLEITQLILDKSAPERTVQFSGQRKATGGGPHPLSTTPEKDTGAENTTTKLSKAPCPNVPLEAGMRQDINEENRSKSIDIEHAKERAQLEKLVYDLRRELEAAGHTLRDQTEALKSVGMGMARMGPHRMAKKQREQKKKLLTASESSIEGEPGPWREFENICGRVKTLEGLLAAERDRSERAERRCAELQATALRSKAKGTQGDATDVVGAGGISFSGSSGEKHGAVLTTETEGRDREVKANEKRLMDKVLDLEDAHRAARRVWGTQEREYRRYIQVLEAAISRMERRMPVENPSKATLFNLTLRLVSCERLLNRRNNGAGSIDPFVVVYSPIGERVLETLPREDTDCPEFSEVDDVVTLKAARGSSWHILFEVYSRGANNVRLFLGQAKVPVGPLLEDVNLGRVRRHSTKLRLRDRETDNELLRQTRSLGTIVFDVTTTVVSGGLARVGRWRSPSLCPVGRLISPGRDGEEDTNPSAGIRRNEGCFASVTGLTLRVAAAKGVLKRRPGVNSSPYVVAYDGCTGSELMRTPPVLGTSEPSWESETQAGVSLSSLGPRGCIIFHVFDYDENGRSEFLGEARISMHQLDFGKEWHEVKLCPREDEPIAYIREHRERLGKLLLHCTREIRTNSVGCTEKQYGHPRRPHNLSRSSRVLCDESVSENGNTLLQPVAVQVHVEGCRGLWDRPGSGNIFVRMVAPNSNAYVTTVVPHTPNPSWMEEGGSATMTLHPLDPGVIAFHVMMGDGQPGGKEQSLGYAQLAVRDLFLLGLGKKELQLDVHPQETDSRFRQRSITELESIVVSFTTPDVIPVNTHREKENSVEKQTTEITAAKTPNQTSAASLPTSSSILKQTEEVLGPTTSSLRIFVKEGQDLLDCDQAMFNVMGVTDPRVLVWVGPDLAFTVPEKRDTVNPVWTQEEAEFILRVQSTQVIRFEVQDVDVSGFDSMGCATIHASEVIDSPGVRRLPVMLDGKQYGTLVVVFSRDCEDCSSS